VAIVGAVITDLLYLAISLVLVGLVGRTLSRNSRAFLPERFGSDGMADAVSRVLVVAYYLLAAGFIALTMPTWSHVPSAGRAMELLSGQVGILLLMLGGLHLAGTAVLARLRRGRPWLGSSAAASSVVSRPVAARTATAATARPAPARPASEAAGTGAGAAAAAADVDADADADAADATPGTVGVDSAGTAAGTAGVASADTAEGTSGKDPHGRLGSTGFWRPSRRDVVH
jgi:hypothetical protein